MAALPADRADRAPSDKVRPEASPAPAAIACQAHAQGVVLDLFRRLRTAGVAYSASLIRCLVDVNILPTVAWEGENYALCWPTTSGAEGELMRNAGSQAWQTVLTSACKTWL